MVRANTKGVIDASVKGARPAWASEEQLAEAIAGEVNRLWASPSSLPLPSEVIEIAARIALAGPKGGVR
jgi:hypothetical protein